MSARRIDFTDIALISAPISSPMMMWPAIMLAASRSASVSGRIRNLITSIRPMTGASPSGRPLPTSLAIFFIGVPLDARTLASHRGRAIATVKTRWLEILITHGTSPARLIATSIRNRDVRSHPTPWITLLPLLLTMDTASVLTVPTRIFLRLLLTNRAGNRRPVIRYAVAQNPVGVSR